MDAVTLSLPGLAGAGIVAPTVLLGRLDGVARILFATWQIHAVAQGASTVVLGFTVFELLFGVL